MLKFKKYTTCAILTIIMTSFTQIMWSINREISILIIFTLNFTQTFSTLCIFLIIEIILA